MSTPGSFDAYVAEHGIQPAEYGEAFAAYLHELTGHEWDGEAERVEPSD